MPRFHQLTRGRTRQFTAEEEAARDAEEKAWADGALDRALVEVRNKRNKKLAKTDLYALSDVTMSDNMKTYRQEMTALKARVTTLEG